MVYLFYMNFIFLTNSLISITNKDNGDIIIKAIHILN